MPAGCRRCTRRVRGTSSAASRPTPTTTAVASTSATCRVGGSRREAPSAHGVREGRPRWAVSWRRGRSRCTLLTTRRCWRKTLACAARPREAARLLGRRWPARRRPGASASAGCFRVRPTRDHVREAKGAHSKGVHSTREERMACRRPGVSAESLPERRECRRVTPGRGWQTRTRARSITKRPQLQAMPPTRVVEEDLGLERFRGRSGTRACPPGGSMLARGASEARALGVAGRSPGVRVGGSLGRWGWGWRGSNYRVFTRGSEAPRRRDTHRAVPGGWGTAQGGLAT